MQPVLKAMSGLFALINLVVGNITFMGMFETGIPHEQAVIRLLVTVFCGTLFVLAAAYTLSSDD